MSSFIDIELGRLGETITGKTPSSSYPEDFGAEYMFVTPSDNLDTKVLRETNRYVSQVGLDRLKGKVLPPKSILVSCIGSAMGKVVINETTCLSNQQINSIVVNDKFDTDYIYYVLVNNYRLLRNAATGSTALPLLNKTDFDLIKIKVCQSKETQKKIARILSDLDAKIELNDKINQELEAMAKTLYDYWFVQFDFPNEQGKPYKSSGGKMVYNEDLKREIPEGWEVKTISEWISNDKGGDWGKETEEGNYTKKVSCIRGADLNGLNGNGTLKPPTRFILERNSNKILENHDLIIEISGGSPTQSTGRLAFITEETLQRFENPVICSNFCKAVRLKEERYLYNFVYQWNRLYDYGILFGWEGKTSGIKNLIFESFVSNQKVVYPKSDLVEKFYGFVKPLHIKKQKNLIENQKLVALRDWLLPMLMNGQVSVGVGVEQLNMAAEPEVEYGKVIKGNFQEKDCTHTQRTILAAYIIKEVGEANIGKTKLMKLLHLTEYYCQIKLGAEYLQKTAGPYDAQMMQEIHNTLTQYNFFRITKNKNGKYQYKSCFEYQNIENLFSNNFATESIKINTLLSKMKGWELKHCEIVSTLYAVWNNRLKRNQLIDNEALKKDFFTWSKRKNIVFSSRDVDKTIAWMQRNNIIPTGWGDFIEKEEVI